MRALTPLGLGRSKSRQRLVQADIFPNLGNQNRFCCSGFMVWPGCVSYFGARRTLSIKPIVVPKPTRQKTSRPISLNQPTEACSSDARQWQSPGKAGLEGSQNDLLRIFVCG